MGDGKCFAKKAPENGPPLFQHGDLVFQAHHVGWIVTGFFTAVATITSIWLVNKHLQWYTNKREQRYIVRLLFLVPIYAIVSFASYLFWDHATALILVRDCYESTVLTAFFYLLLMYLSPNPDEQKAIFLKKGLSRKADRAARKKGHKPGRWVFPLGFIKYKPEDGLYFLQLMKWGVLQYCVIRPITTLAAVLLNYFGLYCETSWSPVWGHIYIVLIVSVSVSVAMYCLIQLYVVVSKELAPRKPLLKLFAVKAVVFLTFWQATGLGMLSVLGVVKDSKYMTAEEINIGIGAILETFEMMLFAFLHIKAFTYKPYRPPTLPGDPPPGRTNQFRSLGHVFDFRETFREIWAGSIYIIDRMKGREPRPDRSVRRVAHMEKALGRVRPGFEVEMEVGSGKEELADRDGEPGKVVMEGEAEDDVGERIWLGIGDDDRYGLSYGRRREKSEAFGEQVEKELRKRGYELGITGRLSAQIEDVEIGQEHQHQQQKSWWRSIYDRISQAGADSQRERLTPGPSRRKSRSQSIYRSTSHHHSRDHRPNHQSRDMDHVSLSQDDEYEDPPPGSVIKNYRHSKQWRESGGHGHRQSDTDVLAPLDVFDQHQSRNHRPHLQVVQRDLPPIPQSSQGSALAVPATHVSRCDSLLARVFPNATSLASSSDHGTESTTSRTHSTSRTRLMPPTPVVVKQVIAHHLPSGVGGAEDIQNSYAHFLSPEVTIHGVDYEDVPSQPSHRRLSAHTDIPLPPLPRREHTQALQSPPRERPHRRESAQTGPSPSPQGSAQMRLDVLPSSPPRMDSPHRKKTGHEVLSTPTSDVLRAAQRAHTALPSQPLRVSPHRRESAHSEQSSSHPRSSIPLDEHVADAYPHALASEFRQSDVQQSSGQSPYHGGSADTHSVASTALREQPPPLPFSPVPPSPPVTASPLTSQPRGFTHQSVPSLRRISDVVSPPYIPPKRRTQKRLSTAPVHFSTPNQPVNYQSSQQGRIPQPRSHKRTSTPLEGSPFPIQMPRLSHSRPIHSLDISNTSIHLPTHSLSPGSSHRKFIPLSAAPPGVRATSQPSHSADFSGLPIPGLLDESPSFLRRSDSRYPSTGVINALQEDRIPGWDGIYS